MILGKCTWVLRIWDIRICPCEVNKFWGSTEDLMLLVYRDVYISPDLDQWQFDGQLVLIETKFVNTALKYYMLN